MLIQQNRNGSMTSWQRNQVSGNVLSARCGLKRMGVAIMCLANVVHKFVGDACTLYQVAPSLDIHVQNFGDTEG
jgi:hypothetical protein